MYRSGFGDDCYYEWDLIPKVHCDGNIFSSLPPEKRFNKVKHGLEITKTFDFERHSVGFIIAVYTLT